MIRYVLTANAPETKDNDFSWRDFQTRNNSELVAIFGNFVNRAIVLTHKYFQGKVPQAGQLQEIDRAVMAELPVIKESLERNLEGYHFREALKDAMAIARLGNKYISDTEPWKIAKSDMARCATILNISLQICANLAIAFEPFTPFAAERLRKMLCTCINSGIDHRSGEHTSVAAEHSADAAQHSTDTAQHATGCCACSCSADAPSGEVICLNWDMLGKSDILPAGHAIAQAELLFSKVEDSEIEFQLKRLEEIKAQNEAKAAAAAAAEAPPEPLAPECTFDDFAKMDIRTATVLEAERVPKTDKLLKLTIDTGVDKRVIVSGIAEYYTPEQMVGRQICILANLQPRKIRGIESKGMILMAKEPGGKMRFITPEETLRNGSQIG